MSEPLIERPSGACQLCRPPLDQRWRHAAPGRQICESCHEQLSDTLQDVGRRYYQLNPRPSGSGGAHDERGAPGFSSRPGGNLHIIAMRDTRSSTVAHIWVGGDGRIHSESEHPPLSVVSVLETEAYSVAELREYGHQPPGTVYELVRWLTVQLDWISRQTFIADFDAALRELQHQLQPVTGSPRIWISVCPNTITDAEDNTRNCTGNLFAPGDDATHIGCSTCGRRWGRPEWVELAAQRNTTA